MLSLEKGRLRGDTIALFKYLKDSHTQEGQDLFLIIPDCKTCNNGLKLQDFTDLLTEQYNNGTNGSNARGIQEKIGQPPVESILSWIPVLSRGVDSMAL